MNIEIFTDSIEMRCENSSNTSRSSNSPHSEYTLDAESKYFLICKSCFWCASCLNRSNMITRCPMCDNNDDGLLDSIPISDN
jgi:hypothetical protein